MKLTPVRMAFRLAPWLIVALLIFAFSGCGFQPRGQHTNLSRLPHPLSISGIGQYTPLYRALRRQLETAGFPLAADQTSAGAILGISKHLSESRVLSVNRLNKAVEHELEEAARIVLTGRDGRQLIEPQTLRVIRVLFRPGETILGSDREQEQLRDDMRQDLAEQILRHIAAQY